MPTMTNEQRSSYRYEVAICRICTGEIGIGEEYHQPSRGKAPMCLPCTLENLEEQITELTLRIDTIKNLRARIERTGKIPLTAILR